MKENLTAKEVYEKIITEKGANDPCRTHNMSPNQIYTKSWEVAYSKSRDMNQAGDVGREVVKIHNEAKADCGKQHF